MAVYLDWGCRGRCLLHKTGSGWGCGGQFWVGRWHWGTERTSDGTNFPPSSWQPARPLQEEKGRKKQEGKGRLEKKQETEKERKFWSEQNVTEKIFMCAFIDPISGFKNKSSDSSCLCISSSFEYDFTCCLSLLHWLLALNIHPHSFCFCVYISLSWPTPFLSSPTLTSTYCHT